MAKKNSFIAEYKVGKAVYQITEDGFVDNINPNIPGIAMTYPWEDIYASLEYERVENRRTRQIEPVLRWLRVYVKGGQMIAEMGITPDLSNAMIRFYEIFKETQKKAVAKAGK